MKKVIVIGAGASGMIAAIFAARAGASVTVLEAMEKPGKKLLLTGSGRCNLTNLKQTMDCYRGLDQAFIQTVLTQFPVEKTLAFFHEIGLLTCDRDGYVYPQTGQAASVLDVLLLEMKRLKVKLKCKERVTDILPASDGFLVRTASWTYEADSVILSAGSMAMPDTGSDGNGYRLAQAQGHRIIDVREALVPLKIKETWIRKLAGVRMPAKIELIIHDKQSGERRYKETGELQWTEYGLSGIAIFQVSRYASAALANGQSVSVCLDLLSDLSQEEVYAHLDARRNMLSTCACTAEEFLSGILPKRGIVPLLKNVGIPNTLKAADLTDAQLHAFVTQCKQLMLTVSGTKSFTQAQVCQGGVDCRELHPQTMQSRKVPGLYLTGELLDVDGICGGYNLQWAWASGYVAGCHAGMIHKNS